jgi:PAS domain S-box-containing protein
MSLIMMHKPIAKYFFAIIIATSTILVNVLIKNTDTDLPLTFPLLFAAVSLAVYLAGMGPGLLTLAILLVSEQLMLAKELTSNIQLVVVMLFICEIALISLLITRLAYKNRKAQAIETQRKTAEMSEQRFRKLVDSIDHLVFTVDRDIKVTGIYGKWLNRFGIAAESIIGRTPTEMFASEMDVELHSQKYHKALSGESVHYEWGVQIGGKDIFFDIALAPLTDESGAVISLVGTGKEITVYKEYQQVAHQLNKQISNVIESITNAFFALDGEWRFTYINSKAESLLQKTAAELLGRNIWEQLPDLTRTLAYNNYREALAKQTTIEFEEYYSHEAKWYQVNVYPAAEGLAVYYADITDRKQIEAELRKSEEKHRSLIEQVQDYAIIMLDGTGHIVSWNIGAERLYGYDSAETSGKHISLLFPTETPIAEVAEWLEVARSKGKFFDETWQVRKNGSRYFSSVLIGSVKDTDGELLGYSVVIRDMTEQMETEKRKNEFISIASHELKTPLTSIKVFTQLLQKRLVGQSDKAVEHHIERMGIQINKITNLVEDLLDISKIESGKLQLKMKEFELNDLVNQIIEDFRYTTDIQIIVKEMGQDSKIYGDTDRLGQVITNLLSNAIKYSPESDRVVVRTKSKIDGIEFSVEDFGIGIPKDQQPRIFERFYRANPLHNEAFSGLGLGLYISAEIISRHNGKIGFRSIENVGSTFYFVLPHVDNSINHSL